MINRRAGLEAIILYKLIKAGAEALAGVGALIAIFMGAEQLAATLAQTLLDHGAHEWTLKAARLIELAGTRQHLYLVVFAAFADAALSAIEGLALRAGRWWAPWLVVVATSALLPWELREIFRHLFRTDAGFPWSRVLILVINLAVVVYLLLGALREGRAHRELTAQPDALPPPAPTPTVPSADVPPAKKSV